MDFIERLFHASPDGGSGATEAVFVIALSIIVIRATLLLRARARARASKRG